MGIGDNQCALVKSDWLHNATPWQMLVLPATFLGEHLSLEGSSTIRSPFVTTAVKDSSVWW